MKKVILILIVLLGTSCLKGKKCVTCEADNSIGSPDRTIFFRACEIKGNKKAEEIASQQICEGPDPSLRPQCIILTE